MDISLIAEKFQKLPFKLKIVVKPGGREEGTEIAK